jgi:malate synthase
MSCCLDAEESEGFAHQACSTYRALVDRLRAERDELATENEKLQKRLETAWERSDDDAAHKISMFVEKQSLSRALIAITAERDKLVAALAGVANANADS